MADEEAEIGDESTEYFEQCWQQWMEAHPSIPAGIDLLILKLTCERWFLIGATYGVRWQGTAVRDRVEQLWAALNKPSVN